MRPPNIGWQLSLTVTAFTPINDPHGSNSWLRLEVDLSLRRRKIMYIKVHWVAYCHKNTFQSIR